MKNLTLFALLLCFFAMVGKSSSLLTKRNRFLPIKQVTRKLTRKEIANLEPKIDGIPRGTVQPHPMTGQVTNKKPAVVGGSSATDRQFPWMVALIFDLSWFCGGSVISPSWVLTAGHCVYEANNTQMFMGSTNWRDNNTRIAFVSNVLILHENYSDTTILNDIGLIKILTPISNAIITSGRVVPIQLPRQSQANLTFVDQRMTASGWGLTSNFGTAVSNTLNYVSLLIMSNIECTKVYGVGTIASSMICTSRSYSNICNGDSGSSLMQREATSGNNTIYGIVSFGGIFCSFYPSGYTRVTSFLAWISNKTELAIRP